MLRTPAPAMDIVLLPVRKVYSQMRSSSMVRDRPNRLACIFTKIMRRTGMKKKRHDVKTLVQYLVGPGKTFADALEWARTHRVYCDTVADEHARIDADLNEAWGLASVIRGDDSVGGAVEWLLSILAATGGRTLQDVWNNIIAPMLGDTPTDLMDIVPEEYRRQGLEESLALWRAAHDAMSEKS